MKKNYIAALALGILLSGCQETEKATKTTENQNSTTEEKATAIAEKDKMAYAIGANMAGSIMQINQDFKAVELNTDAVKQGFIAKLQQNSALNDEEVNQQLQMFQQKMKLAQQQQMEENLLKKTEENKAFFEKIAKEGYTKTDSGLYYKVLQEGKTNAPKPTEKDEVSVHYTGTFINGEKFDSSVDRNEPFKFSLKGGVIQGWIEGVKYMSLGSKYQFVIPPELGYGERDRGHIKGGSVLIFDVELLEIIDPSKPKPAAKDKK